MTPTPVCRKPGGTRSNVSARDETARNERIPVSGRVGVPPAGFGVSPKQAFCKSRSFSERSSSQESSERRDAFAGGRDAHPTRDTNTPLNPHFIHTKPMKRTQLLAGIALALPITANLAGAETIRIAIGTQD